MFQTLLSQLKQYKKATIATPLLAVLEVLMEIMIPVAMASIIDEGIEKGDMRHVILCCILMFFMAGLSLLFGILAGRTSARASTGFAANLREGMFSHIQTFSFANIDKFSTAGLVTRMTTDVTNIQNAFQMIIKMGTRAPVQLICALVMAMVINFKLSMIFVAAILILGSILALIISKAMPAFTAVFDRYDELNASVQENVSGIRVVKAFVREEHENSKFTRAAGRIYEMFIKAESIVALNNPVMMFVVYSCILGLSWLGAQMIVGGSLTTGELTSLLAYVMNILMSLMMLSMIFVMLSLSMASARRIAEVLNEEATLVSPENADFEIPDGSVDFDHVFFAYGNGKPVLSDIDVHIKAGETIGILGGTGSAKSSLVNLISRLYDVQEGCVKVGGKDVRAYDLETLRNEVAVVLQKNVLFSGTILENLRWGDENATDEDCIRACKMACAHEFITQFPDGYETYIEQGGTNVSGGQKQRLCIARALLKKPKILVLDDSTSAVDTATDARIRRAFREEIPGTTKFIIAQRISSIQDADRILVLEDGKIDGFDTHENLLAHNEIYQDVYNSQTQGGGDFDQKGGEA
ncbi:MAG: ABC transporter ATP-binding protein [Lachnospiraceae bacterium]|nr:ABC transporter ATP-binding protein [Lachnospiraceae bacterium]